MVPSAGLQNTWHARPFVTSHLWPLHLDPLLTSRLPWWLPSKSLRILFKMFFFYSSKKFGEGLFFQYSSTAVLKITYTQHLCNIVLVSRKISFFSIAAILVYAYILKRFAGIYENNYFILEINVLKPPWDPRCVYINDENCLSMIHRTILLLNQQCWLF